MQESWNVTERTYEDGSKVTEFTFPNGVVVHYDDEKSALYVYLVTERNEELEPVRTDRVVADDFVVGLDSFEGKAVGIEIVKLH